MNKKKLLSLQGERGVRHGPDELLRHEPERVPGQQARAAAGGAGGARVTATRGHLHRVPALLHHLPRRHDHHLRRHPAGRPRAQHPQEHRQHYCKEKVHRHDILLYEI